MSRNEDQTRWTEAEIREWFARPLILSNGKKVVGKGVFANLLRRVWNHDLKWDATPTATAVLLAECLNANTGVVNRSKEEFPASYGHPGETPAEYKKRKSRDNASISKAQRKRRTAEEIIALNAQNLKAKKLRKLRGQKGLLFDNDSPDVNENNLWSWLREHVITPQSIDFDNIPLQFARTNTENSNREVFERFSEVQRECFFNYLDQLEIFVERSIGHENFYGTENYRWNAVTWFSAILRIVESSIFASSDPNNCINATENRMSVSDRPRIVISVRSEQTTKVMAKVLNVLFNSFGVFDEVLNSTIETSHLCHRGICIQPRHLIFETNEANKDRIGCVYGSSSTCTHEPSCRYFDVTGRYLPCKNDYTKTACDVNCSVGCFQKLNLDLPVDIATAPVFVDMPIDMYTALVVEFGSQSFRQQFPNNRNAILDILASKFERFVDVITISQNSVRLPTSMVLQKKDWIRVFTKLTDSINISTNADGCFEWTGSFKDDGRPYLWVLSVTTVGRFLGFLNVKPETSRFLYSSPEAFEGSHLCSVGTCVNPSHFVLESGLYNKTRGYCLNGSPITCPHIPSCIFSP
ncbi:His-Cys box protein [Aphelenchoides besseyi]|nr:His-Cys box protein [Aphelenchoides besseyi]